MEIHTTPLSILSNCTTLLIVLLNPPPSAAADDEEDLSLFLNRFPDPASLFLSPQGSPPLNTTRLKHLNVGRFGDCLNVLLLHQPLIALLILQLNKIFSRDTLYFITEEEEESWSSSSTSALFQSPLFREAHPHVVLVRAGGVVLNPICYLCPEPLQPIAHPPLLNRHLLLSHLQQLNSYGWGKPAAVAALGDDNTYEIRRLERRMQLENWKIGYTVKVMLGLLSYKLNFTLRLQEVEVEDPPKAGPRLFICLHCEGSWRRVEARVGLRIMHVNEEAFFYCRPFGRAKEGSSIQFLLSPFDGWIWGCLLCAILLLLLIFRDPWFSLNILWGLLGIPYHKWRRPKILSLLALGLLIPQFYYIAFFTSDVIAPAAPNQILTNQQLFTVLGYRFYRTACEPQGSWERYTEGHLT